VREGAYRKPDRQGGCGTSYAPSLTVGFPPPQLVSQLEWRTREREWGYALPRSSGKTLKSFLAKLYAISFLLFRGPVSSGNFLP